MPGLLRGIARTAIVAGTATAVSNRVSRRQAGRWAAQDAPPAGYAPAGYAPGGYATGGYASGGYGDAGYAEQAPPPPPPPPPTPGDGGGSGGADTLAQLRELGELRSQGVLTEQEFEDQKRRILGS